MYQPTSLTPGMPVPTLNVGAGSGERWSFSENTGDNFTLIAFYRGYHCPKCRDQLQDLQNHADKFAELKTNIVAISMDPDDRREKSVPEWGIEKFDLLNGFTIDQAKEWGLHLSVSRGKTSIGVEELQQFNEPGLFLVRADRTLFASWVQTVPAGRPQPADLIGFITFVLDKDYPPRGTLTDI